MKDYVTIRVKDQGFFPSLAGLDIDGYRHPLSHDIVVFAVQYEGDEEATEYLLEGEEYDLVHESEPDVIFETELKPLYVVEYRNRLKDPDEWVYGIYGTQEEDAYAEAKKGAGFRPDRQYRVRKVVD